ncbi:hypothetical protein HYDPIDRAFT_108589 [Hydnomerulius pinastri MD-312]|nr:hypothetical protein HYDPIDRAFT_108589 [Hydnomerulius pinastri MD-312]
MGIFVDEAAAVGALLEGLGPQIALLDIALKVVIVCGVVIGVCAVVCTAVYVAREIIRERRERRVYQGW